MAGEGEGEEGRWREGGREEEGNSLGRTREGDREKLLREGGRTRQRKSKTNKNRNHPKYLGLTVGPGLPVKR